MADNIETWMCFELQKMGIDASEDIASYILGMESAEDIEEYMVDFLDSSNPRSKRFLKELLVKWRPLNNSRAPTDVQVYLKPDVIDDYSMNAKKSSSNKKTDKRSSPKPIVLNGHDAPSTHNRGILPGEEKSYTNEKEVRKKQSKFVPLYSKEGQDKDVIQLPGRHVCECQAAKHQLVSNCTKCGRVVCQQEGSGPCLFCGNLVCTAEEADILSKGTKKSEKLRAQLMRAAPTTLLNDTRYAGERDYLPNSNAKMREGFTKAQQHKEKLLEYDKTSVRRTQVIDDEADYFATESKWLSKDERAKLSQREEELRSKKYASRKDRKITLDFAGRQVLEEDNSVNVYDVNDSVVQQIHHGARPKTKSGAREGNTGKPDDGYLVNPNIVSQAPQFVSQASTPKNSTRSSNSASDKKPTSSSKMSRIQDRELQEMSDEGQCMSMHQPWASLLIAGIKIHEGRNWYTAHRGRLWIAATAKTPEMAEIADMEETYKFLYKDKQLDFPTHYPVGCLLGCVDVVDCLPQDIYTEQFPEGESGSPFVFICDNPHELLVKFPIKGKHKIYKLESHIHKAAKKGLR